MAGERPKRYHGLRGGRETGYGVYRELELWTGCEDCAEDYQGCAW